MIEEEIVLALIKLANVKPTFSLTVVNTNLSSRKEVL